MSSRIDWPSNKTYWDTVGFSNTTLLERVLPAKSISFWIVVLIRAACRESMLGSRLSVVASHESLANLPKLEKVRLVLQRGVGFGILSNHLREVLFKLLSSKLLLGYLLAWNVCLSALVSSINLHRK